MSIREGKILNNLRFAISDVYRSRELRFAISVLLSIIIYASILHLSRNVPLFISGHEKLPTYIRVKIFEDVEQETAYFEEPVATTLSTKPITFQELIDQVLSPPQIPQQNIEITPEQMAHKAGTEQLPRQTEFVSSPELVQEIEEEVLAVDKSLLAENVEVPRIVPSKETEKPLVEPESIVFPLDDIAFGEAPRIPSAPSVIGAIPATLSTSTTGITEGTTTASPLPVQPPQLEPVKTPISLEEAFEQEVVKQPIFEEANEEKQKRKFEFWDDMVDIKLKTYHPPQDSESYFELNIIPKTDANIPILQKQVSIVVDCSASIGQRKLDKTLQGVREALKTLNPGDVFNVVIFRDRASYFMPGFVKATPENISQAQNFLIGLESLGRTDVYSSLLPLVQSSVNPNIANIIYLFSDGRATTGITDAKQIIANLSVENNGKYEIYSASGGKTADKYLLYMLSYVNKGKATIIPDIEKIPSEIQRFFVITKSPILVNIKANFTGLGNNEIYPFVIPNFYKGNPITLYGKFNPDKVRSFVFRIDGTSINNTKKEIIFRADLTESQKGDSEIEKMWAMHKAYYIISKIIREGMKQEYISELEQIKTKHKVGTVYTP